MIKKLKFKGKDNSDISVVATDQLVELILEDKELNDFNIIFLYWEEWNKIVEFTRKVKCEKDAKIRN